MNGHLITVKISVIGHTHQWVQLNGFAFNQDGFESLDTKSMKGGCPVEKNWMFFDYLIQNVPDLRALFLHHLLCTLNSGRISTLFKFIVDKGFKELQRHIFGQTALVQTQFGADDNDRTARVVYSFAQKVLAKPSALALEHIG